MITAYIKPTNYCNVDCEHCYLPESTRANKNLMSDRTLIQTLEMINQMAIHNGSQSAHIIWHGGEPLTIRKEWYENAYSIIDNFQSIDITTSMQTSLIPFTEDWVPLIKNKMDSFVGSSIDFTQRKIKGSPENYLDLWLKKVFLARSYNIEIVPGMVPTVHEVGKEEEIVNWFVKNDFKRFNIDRFSRYGNEENIDWPTNKQHAQFLINLFDNIFEYIKNGIDVPIVNVVVGGILVSLGLSSYDRWGTNCQKSFLVIEPDGSINSCPDRAMHEKPFSNVSNGHEDLIRSKGRRNWIRVMDVTHKKNHCMSCEFNKFCKSGCPVTPNGYSEGQEECSGYYSFLNHVKNFCHSSEANMELAMKYAGI